MVGSWNVNVTVGKMPQKVATAFGTLSETLLGAEYTPIAYLGSQVVNGTNHAVLAEQLVITGKDTKNVVVVVFNEKPGSMDPLTLVSIDRVVESGLPMGGTKVDVKTELSEEDKDTFKKSMGAFVGSKVEPFALLATQVSKGMDYIYAAEVTPVTENPVKSVALVTVNSMKPGAQFVDLLAGKQELVGYAFTWLGAPLGEWP